MYLKRENLCIASIRYLKYILLSVLSQYDKTTKYVTPFIRCFGKGKHRNSKQISLPEVQGREDRTVEAQGVFRMENSCV